MVALYSVDETLTGRARIKIGFFHSVKLEVEVSYCSKSSPSGQVVKTGTYWRRVRASDATAQFQLVRE